MSSYEARFGGIARLFGRSGMEKLRAAHVAVIGLGGVGSWATEALARSGVGALTLVDLDDVCIGNTNRQLHALDGEFGRPKVEVLTRRVRAINPECIVHPCQSFFTRTTASDILKTRFDFVLDAIDSPSKKCLLVARCRELHIPVIVTGASAGKRDLLAVRVKDLAFSSHDRLLQEVRKKLRARDGFPRQQQPFGVLCVYSDEPPVFATPDGAITTERDQVQDLRLDCSSGLGTASFVTGTFGLVAAGQIVRQIAEA